MNRTRTRAPIAGWGAAMLAAISLRAGPVAVPAVQADPVKALADGEARWQAKKPASYRMTVDVMCFCLLAKTPPTFRVVDDVPRAESDLGASAGVYARYDTVPKLFAELKRLMTVKPVKLDVTYHPIYGFPSSIDLDVRTEVADDELKVTITNFEPLGAGRR